MTGGTRCLQAATLRHFYCEQGHECIERGLTLVTTVVAVGIVFGFVV